MDGFECFFLAMVGFVFGSDLGVGFFLRITVSGDFFCRGFIRTFLIGLIIVLSLSFCNNR